MKYGKGIKAVAVDDLMATPSIMEQMNEFYTALAIRYKSKPMGLPSRYIGWHLHSLTYGDHFVHILDYNINIIAYNTNHMICVC